MKIETRNIGDILQVHVDKIINTKYKDDLCQPKSVISQLGDHILLTIIHSGWAHSGVIGFEVNIEELITDLYNKTM